ncbi:unnamed protein product [Choristocarpus tenellus]
MHSLTDILRQLGNFIHTHAATLLSCPSTGWMVNVFRMGEAIELFREICLNPYFERSSIILFLNKKDLFAEKIPVKDISTVPEWSDFRGPCTFDKGVNYFLEKFLSSNITSKTVYHHVTCATDSENIRVVFNSCKDTILRNNLRTSGFMD